MRLIFLLPAQKSAGIQLQTVGGGPHTLLCLQNLGQQLYLKPRYLRMETPDASFGMSSLCSRGGIQMGNTLSW